MKFPDVFTPDQERLVTALKARDLEERKAGSTDPLRIKAVSATVAHYLYMQVLRGPARHIAEFGTSAGYSTIHLAHAARRCGGRVYTLDREPKKTALACENIHLCGLADYVDFSTGDIADFIAQLPTAIDFAFFDFGVPSFAGHWHSIKEKMAANAFLFVDGWEQIERWNSEPEWSDFKGQLEADSDFITMLLPLEKGQKRRTSRPCAHLETNG